VATTYYYSIDGQILGQQVLGEAEGKDYLLDASGNLVGVYQGDYLKADASYDAFGNILDSWNISFYNFTWGGGHGYRQTGLAYSSVYVRARHYSNLDAGWTTRDPLWPSEMPYGYVNGRVPGGVDPSGMGPKSCLDNYQRAIKGIKIKPADLKKLEKCFSDCAKKKGIEYDQCVVNCAMRAGFKKIIPALQEYVCCYSSGVRYYGIDYDPTDPTTPMFSDQRCCDYRYCLCLLRSEWKPEPWLIKNLGLGRTCRSDIAQSECAHKTSNEAPIGCDCNGYTGPDPTAVGPAIYPPANTGVPGGGGTFIG